MEPVDNGQEGALREQFSLWIHRRSLAPILVFWNRQIFSARGVPPPELASDDQVLDFVGQRLGAIGYVSNRARLGANVRGLEIAR